MLAFGGCSSSLQERRAYDAAARAKRNQVAIDKMTKLQEAIAAIRNGIDREGEPTLYCMVEDLLKPLQQLENLARNDLGRARIAQLDHGTPPDLEVELGAGKDDAEVVAYAGLATERSSKRIRRKGWWKRLGEGVAEFAGGFAVGSAVTIREVTKAIVPSWLLWVLAIALVIAIGIGLYALYQRLVIRRKDRAIDEYDDAMEVALEGRDHEERKDIGRGDHLKREHFSRNEHRKRHGRPVSEAWRELEINYTPHEKVPEGGVPPVDELLPLDRTRHPHRAATEPSAVPTDGE